jgi:hypothetical protein
LLVAIARNNSAALNNDLQPIARRVLVSTIEISTWRQLHKPAVLEVLGVEWVHAQAHPHGLVDRRHLERKA